MSRQINLLYAEEAIKHVETILRGKACNRGEDIAHQLQQKIGPTYAQQVQGLKDADKYTGKSTVLESALDKQAAQHGAVINKSRQFYNTWNADQVKLSGVGNCHEHAIPVGEYLAKKKIKANVYYVTTADDPIGNNIDHVWNIIHVHPARVDCTYKIALDDDPNLGPDAVVCDAWYNEWFSVQNDWARKMGTILRRTMHNKGPLPAKVWLDFKKQWG